MILYQGCWGDGDDWMEKERVYIYIYGRWNMKVELGDLPHSTLLYFTLILPAKISKVGAIVSWKSIGSKVL